ncbi:sn-glycerol-3-phosphate import ATP-binding protein UgpC [compost metagenome]
MHEGEVVLTIRPEEIRLSEQNSQDSVPAVVEAVFPAGAETLVQLRAGEAVLMARVMGESDAEPGDMCYAALRRERLNLYDKRTGSRLENLVPLTHILEDTLHENRLSYSR